MAKRMFHRVNRPIATRQVLFLALDKGKEKNKSLYDYPFCALLLEWPQDGYIPQTEKDIKKYLRSIKLKVVDEFKANQKSNKVTKTTQQEDLMSYLIAGLAGDVFEQQDEDGYITLAKLCNYVENRIRKKQLQGVHLAMPQNTDLASKIIRVDPQRINNLIVRDIEHFYHVLLGPMKAESLVRAADIIKEWKFQTINGIEIDTDLIQALEKDFRNVLEHKYKNEVRTWLDQNHKKLRDEAMNYYNKDRQDPALTELNFVLGEDLKDLLDRELADLLKTDDTSIQKSLLLNDRDTDSRDIKRRASFHELFSLICDAIRDSITIEEQIHHIINRYIFSQRLQTEPRATVKKKSAEVLQND
jgi:hypothetical protein